MIFFYFLFLNEYYAEKDSSEQHRVKAPTQSFLAQILTLENKIGVFCRNREDVDAAYAALGDLVRFDDSELPQTSTSVSTA